MKKTILVVEDEVVIAMDLRNTLIDLGYEVPKIITSGELAIETALEAHPDLILMDIHLSNELDGIDAAEQIIAEIDIPVVYLTAYADEETLKRASKTMPFGYILKPFEVRELRASIEIAFYKHQSDKLLKENRKWLLAVLNSINEGVAVSNVSGAIEFMNPVAEVLTGWTQAETLGKPLTDVLVFINESTRQPIEHPIAIVLREGQPISLPENTLLLAKQGGTTPVSDSVSPIRNDRGVVDGAVVVFRDSTEQKRMQAWLKYNALHDSLTQLPNRTLFLNQLQQAVERAKDTPEFGFVVMLLDLDRFKNINDTFGHFVGDRLLVKIAQRFTLQIRGSDTIARLGGDEFAIILENTKDVAIACHTAERLITVLKQPFRIGEHELSIAASIGIVLSSMPHEQATDLLQDVDIAMYRAKAQGRSTYVVFDAEMHRQAQVLIQLEQDLRQAVFREEFRVHYQPIVSLRDRVVISFEALVRWQKPGYGLMYPASFIALAEEMGLIRDIDRWVLQEACRQLKMWQQLGCYTLAIDSDNLMKRASNIGSPLTMAINVNLSARHFVWENLVEMFNSILQETRLEGSFLKLEVTESIFIENADKAAQTLSELKSLGIRICLDDFGTGYSSLRYLHKFPIDMVKIDRSFIQGIENDLEKLEIVRAILGLCHNLNIEVTAEGIETQTQEEILLDLACEYGQGYLYAQAIEGVTITRLLSPKNI